jgi:hypothetical protein
MIGLIIFIIGLAGIIPVIPIPGLMHLTASIKGIGVFSGPAGYVLVLIGGILMSMGY